jgi:hypothetical protein
MKVRSKIGFASGREGSAQGAPRVALTDGYGRRSYVAQRLRAIKLSRSLEDSWNIFPPHVAQVKLTRKRHAAGVLDVARLSDGHMFVEHPVHANISGSCLMDQPFHGNRIEVRLDPVRVQGHG